MARVIILAFSDDAAAERFAQLKDDFESNPDAETDPAEDEGKIILLGATVAAHTEMEAMIARPTVFCRCTSGTGKGTYYKTTKFGWWIHRPCKKPTYTIVKNFIHNMTISVGNDLLPGLRKQRATLAANAQTGTGSGGDLATSATEILASDPSHVQAGTDVSISAESATSPDELSQRDDPGGVSEVPASGESVPISGTDSEAPLGPGEA